MKKNYLEKCIFNRKFLLATLCSTAVLFAGCQSEETSKENNQTVENDDSSTTTQEESNEKAKSNEKVESNEEVAPKEEENNIEQSTPLFSEMSKYEFIFSSGVGAWQTGLSINEDGTFEGVYSDANAGEIGEGYPNGTIYTSSFKGKFTLPKQVNDYTYSTTIESIELEKEVGAEEIIDEVKYIYSEPYGMDGAKEFYIYTPEAPINELPEGFKSWVIYNIDENQDNLSFYGLYNVETESGFYSYKVEE